ncbi:hypothetical protein [Marinobacter nauticus]|uniref:hypothetical protein n=1 Tax=Marinobacter nauticus TaxID=2743 RepID=UPI0011C05FA7|nr:hypothetical protein [Marinobacter nauticus]
MSSFDARYNVIKNGLNGGMSSASILHDSHLDRLVLLKTLAPEVEKARLLDEISALMKLRSKHVPESVTSLANIPVKPTSAPTRGDNWVRF